MIYAATPKEIETRRSGAWAEQIPAFVHGASLYRYALPDGGKRLLQSRRKELRSERT
jgi:hypothetical protein